MTIAYLSVRLVDQCVDEVVGLDAEALSSRDFNVVSTFVFLGKFDVEIDTATR